MNIAYQAFGDGPVDLVFVPGFISHIELAWEEPYLARFLRRLAVFTRVIFFDKRGTGLSDPVSRPPGLAERMDDIRAVMDAAGSQRAALFGVSDGGCLCIAFAVAHPDRSASLVTYGSFARRLRTAGYPWGWSAGHLAEVLRGMDRNSARSLQLIARHLPKCLHGLGRDFAGVQGSRIYNALVNGKLTYRSYCMAKPVPPR